jgi:hypothetical protein
VASFMRNGNVAFGKTFLSCTGVEHC